MSDPRFTRIALRVPGGWCVDYNEWYDVDPATLQADDRDWSYLTETLLHVRHIRFGMAIDVGWYPEASSDGRFGLKVLYEGDWSSPIHSDRTTSRREILELVEALLLQPPIVPVGRVLGNLSGIDPEARARAAELLDRQDAIETIDILKEACVREPHVPTLETMNRVLENLMRSSIQQRKRAEDKNADRIPLLVEEAIARAVATETPARRGASVLAALLALPGAQPLGRLGVRCFEYEIRVGLLGNLSQEQQTLVELAGLVLACKPDFVSCTSLSDEERDGVLVLRYGACKGEVLVEAPAWKDPFRASACKRFRSELKELSELGKVHPYVRGAVHWLVSSETGTLLLERWSAVRDASEGEREESLEAVDEILVERGEASTRTQSRWSGSPSRMKVIPEVFGQRRVLLPVVHPVTSRAAKTSVQAALDAGCKGIFLINQGMSSDQVLDLTMDIRRNHPTLWIGLNLLGTRPSQVLSRGLEALDGRLDGIWVDNAGVDRAPASLSEAEEFVAVRRELNWNGLYFGGVAFKYQPDVSADRLPEVCAAADRFMDVVTTSGPGTGEAAPLPKVQAMRALLGESSSLALASGVDANNVSDYLPYVDAYLVGSSLEHEFGVFDPERVQILQARIKNSRWT